MEQKIKKKRAQPFFLLLGEMMELSRKSRYSIFSNEDSYSVNYWCDAALKSVGAGPHSKYETKIKEQEKKKDFTFLTFSIPIADAIKADEMCQTCVYRMEISVEETYCPQLDYTFELLEKGNV